MFKTLQQIINRPPDVFELLGRQIPVASTFFMTFLLLRGLIGGAVELLQIGPVIQRLIMLCFSKTPREKAWAKSVVPCDYGLLFPQFSFIFCIGTTELHT